MKLKVFSPNDVSGKKVLVRVDFNVPVEDGRVKDDTRVNESIPTLVSLLDAGAKPTLVSHLGRPKGKPNPAYSLEPIVSILSELMKASSAFFKGVSFIPDTVGAGVAKAVSEQDAGKVLLLENTRFCAGEEANDEGFAEALSKPFEVFVNDAFASLHRAHASTEGVTHFLPSFAGLLVEKEVKALSCLANPTEGETERPYVVLIGGKKISDKLPVLRSLIGKADMVLVGGAIANTLSKATGVNVGKSLAEDDLLTTARELVEDFRNSSTTLVLPSDFTVTNDLDTVNFLANRKIQEVGKNEICADIGEATRNLFTYYLRGAKTIFWNGAMGVFEKKPFDAGSKAVAEAIASNESAFSVAGGGETVELIVSLNLNQKFSHVSTGGGASLEFVAGRTLPGLTPLMD